jgi:hypothetical protein
MSKRIRARVVVHRRVEYRHAQGQGDGVLLDLSLLGCRCASLRVWDASAAAALAPRPGAARGGRAGGRALGQGR